MRDKQLPTLRVTSETSAIEPHHLAESLIETSTAELHHLAEIVDRNEHQEIAIETSIVEPHHLVEIVHRKKKKAGPSRALPAQYPCSVPAPSI